MKTRHWLIFLTLVFPLVCLGCLPLVVGMAVTDIALTTASWQAAVKQTDYRTTIKAELDRVWQGALETAKEMQIDNLMEERQENGGKITGRTREHKITVILATITPVITDVGIKARKREILGLPVTHGDADSILAVKIAASIQAKCESPQAPKTLSSKQ